MKTMKRTLAVLLAFIMIFSFSCSVSASGLDKAGKELWDFSWNTEDKEYKAAVTMFPGENENDRTIAWYSESDEGYVQLTSGKDTQKITATAKATPQGDYRLYAKLTELKDGKYTYKCVSGDYSSSSHTFTVETGTDFTAVYISDIHVSEDEDNVNLDRLRDTAYSFDNTLDKAYLKALENGDVLDLIVSGGDQAGQGLRSEYEGLSSASLTKIVPFALSVGNHDRKSVNYKYYSAFSNEGDFTYRSYIGTDYWVRQGDALFLMLDSCNCAMKEHYDFMAEATEQNEDAKWIIAVMHHDMFGGREPHLDSENKLLRMMWVPFFDEFGVDLCLYGHSHYYSVSNVIYDRETVSETGHNATVTDAEGTIYIASGSVNNLPDLTDSDGNVPPVGENAGFTFLEQDSIYNLLEFTDNTLTVKSYTVESDKLFNTLTLTKTTKQGGHVYKNSAWYLKPVSFFAGTVVNIINNYDMYKRYVNDGYDVSAKQGLIGS